MFNSLRAKVIEKTVHHGLKRAGIALDPKSQAHALIAQGAKLASDNWTTVAPIVKAAKAQASAFKKTP